MIEWKNEKRRVADLVPADYNPRKLTSKERQDLTDSISRFSTVEPVVVNTGSRNNVLIGGHQRVTIYADLKIEEIDVRVPSRELTIDEEKELNLRLNKNVGSWDWGKLKEFNIDQLIKVGFDDEEMSDMWSDVSIFEDEFDRERKNKPPVTTNVKVGEIYQLGQHRLMCGNSESLDDVKKLMAEQKADMVYCDPPYNIGLDYNKGLNLFHKESQYQGQHSAKDDRKKPEDYSDFVGATVQNALEVSKQDCHFFYWCDQNYIWVMQGIFVQLGLNLKRVCLWVKNNMNVRPQTAFNKCYEPVVYATRGNPFLEKKTTRLNEILNKEVETGNRVYEEIMEYFDIWLVSRDQDYLHPTQKPISLHEKPLQRCTAPGHIVLDLFAGSGSTLIACEQTNRKCYTMEKDPIFCQVVINRWEELTGQKAIKV